MSPGGLHPLPSVTAPVLSGLAQQLLSAAVLDASLAEERMGWNAEMRWRRERRRGQGRAEVFVPGGKESTLKWERADTPQLKLGILGADQQRGAPWKELGMLDTVH